MEERVLGDVPSEGSESEHRFYRQPTLKMRGIARSVLLFTTLLSAALAFFIFYTVLQYGAKVNRPSLGTKNVTVISEQRQKNISSNCSTQVFSFGHDCSEEIASSTEIEEIIQTTEIEFTTPELRRFDETSPFLLGETVIESISKYENEKEITFQRNGRSKWPVVSTPYPYYVPATQTKPGVPTEKDLSVQETNIFAIPNDLENFKPSEKTITRVNFTPPPYVFTPYPNFTDNYAQLSPYKEPQNNSNLNQVMKYLKSESASERNSEIDQSQPVGQVKNTMMKVSGTYVMPLDRRRPGEIILSSSSEIFEKTQPFYNGHAYISDPFTKYRPTDPSEINRLIPVRSSLDTGPRFRRPTVSFVPTTSLPLDIVQPVSSDKDYQQEGTRSHTVAIFHPPSASTVSPPGTPRLRDKPLSVTLDIYPVTVDSETAPVSYASTPAGRERGRVNPKWRPKATERPKWRPPAYRSPTVTAAADQAVENHMIVHLNLFPNKRKPYSLIRRSRTDSSTDSTTRAHEDLLKDHNEPGRLQGVISLMVIMTSSSAVKTAGDGGAIAIREVFVQQVLGEEAGLDTSNARSSIVEEMTEPVEPIISTVTTTTSLEDQPQSSALESSTKPEEETTTITDISQIDMKDEDHSELNKS